MSTETSDTVQSKEGEFLLASAALLLGALLSGRLMRPVLTFAAGVAAARVIWASEATTGAGKSRGAPEWVSDHKPGPSGRLSANQKTDLAMEDSFPASDPPASY